MFVNNAQVRVVESNKHLFSNVYFCNIYIVWISCFWYYDLITKKKTYVEMIRGRFNYIRGCSWQMAKEENNEKLKVFIFSHFRFDPANPHIKDAVQWSALYSQKNNFIIKSSFSSNLQLSPSWVGSATSWCLKCWVDLELVTQKKRNWCDDVLERASEEI